MFILRFMLTILLVSLILGGQKESTVAARPDKIDVVEDFSPKNFPAWSVLRNTF